MTSPSEEDREWVDQDHPYMTEHDVSEFSWEFNGEQAVKYAAELLSMIALHAVECDPVHAISQFSIQAGLTLEDIPANTQYPVLMMDGGDGIGNTPIAILLIEKDRLPLAHTLGTLITASGVYPALPSRMRDEFDSPPGSVNDPDDPTPPKYGQNPTQEDDSE